MTQEEAIKEALVTRFTYLLDRIRIPRPRRLFVDIEINSFTEVLEYVVKELTFAHLVSITGLDELDKFSFIYHLAAENGIIINLKISVDHSQPAVRTITGYFPGAEIYERELVDLFGVRVDGLGEGNRYPLTDDWPKDQYPLRKDWKPSGRKEGN